MSQLNLKPNHAPVKAYYETLEKFGHGKFDNEGNIRGAFEDLLKKCARQFGWMLVPEYRMARKGRNPISIDGALLDDFKIVRGYWEAKDEKDSLEAESKKKFAEGYPRTNILFQKPTRALLIQNGIVAFDDSIADPQKLVDVLALFFGYREPHLEDWEKAVAGFSERIPEIASGALTLIDQEKKTNKRFQESFHAFAELCRQSINPDLKDEAVEEMLVQHLLTERIFRRVFNNPEFTRRNIIAAEIEKVIDSLTKKHFSRDAFLKSLDHFYKAIEDAAATMEDYAEKQHFLNRVYEKFFQGFNKKQADTHGIVYTPQPIVDFMVRSVEEVLQSEFGKSLSDSGVHILDPFVGTGNFITRIMREIKTSRLPQKYREELHCNEVMLLPYYIASMNIEHAYLDRTNEYEPFEGICLVDTFDMRAQSLMFAEKNLERIQRQVASQIFVVIGNPPYNAWQSTENDNNKNRKYPDLDKRISETYSKGSLAANKSSLSDPYIKAFRWASDRIKEEGIVSFVTNNSFIESLAADAMRRTLVGEFDKLYILDLGGSVRKNPKLSGSTHNVFGIQVGVSINILVRRNAPREQRKPTISYSRVGEFWKKEAKYSHLNECQNLSGVRWQVLEPDSKSNWLNDGRTGDFSEMMPLGLRKHGIIEPTNPHIFSVFSNGNDSGRDSWVYNFRKDEVAANARRFAEVYNTEVERYIKAERPEDIDSFVISDEKTIKWTRNAKRDLRRGKCTAFASDSVRSALYHPFTRQFWYPGKIFNKETAQFPRIFPTCEAESENETICVPGAGNRKSFGALVTNLTPTLDVAFEKIQCFPFYTYDEDGTNRHENITDWALAELRKHYADNSISKWDIFHATYAILHHPEYRTRYAANLKRELPRIPFVPEFHTYAKIGAVLMKLHIEYEQQKEYPLQRTEKGTLNWRVEKMKLSKDKTQLTYNDFLTLSGIPPEVYEYRLGNRSALEWIVDQYRVSTDKRSGIVNDPNRADDPEYIVRLIGQVVTVSLETVRLVRELSTLQLLPN